MFLNLVISMKKLIPNFNQCESRTIIKVSGVLPWSNKVQAISVEVVSAEGWENRKLRSVKGPAVTIYKSSALPLKSVITCS